jgi:hypothetical protein
VQVFHKLKTLRQTIASTTKPNGNFPLYYTRKVSFFLQFLDFVPDIFDDNGNRREPSELKVLLYDTAKARDLAIACLSSSIFYWYYILNSDCRNLNKREIVSFPIPDQFSDSDQHKISKLIATLMQSYKNNSQQRTVSYKGKGAITVQYFNFRPSKPIIDEIDRVLARHYGFTDEELDFIINYDIKYRMGDDLFDDEGDE